MARESKVRSEKLQTFLSKIEDSHIQERYEMFLSDHESIHENYSIGNDEPIQALRRAAEALCKLLISVYVPNADQLFGVGDNLIHSYFKITDKHSPDYLKIKEEALNALPTYKYWQDSTILGKLAYALLCKINQKEDSHNKIYNKIKECHNWLYEPLNTDTSHSVPRDKQSPYSAATLYSFYFAWVRGMIDICPDKLSPLK